MIICLIDTSGGLNAIVPISAYGRVSSGRGGGSRVRTPIAQVSQRGRSLAVVLGVHCNQPLHQASSSDVDRSDGPYLLPGLPSLQA
jgi:hypothetical protein